jgi:hypothetical protein
VKDNQRQLRQDIALWFDSDGRVRKGDPPPARQMDAKHGRLVQYTLETTSELNAYLEWPGVQQAFRLRQVSKRSRRAESKETLFYGITSLSPGQASADELLTLWREHWHIENGVHWVRDKVFGEDLSGARSDASAHPLAVLRNLVINVLRIYGYESITSARTRLGTSANTALGLLA